MAIPHKKKLIGKEAGGQSIHWYSFLKSKRAIKRSKMWDGGCPASKPGTTVMVWLGYDKETGKACWSGTC